MRRAALPLAPVSKPFRSSPHGILSPSFHAVLLSRRRLCLCCLSFTSSPAVSPRSPPSPSSPPSLAGRIASHLSFLPWPTPTYFLHRTPDLNLSSLAADSHRRQSPSHRLIDRLPGQRPSPRARYFDLACRASLSLPIHPRSVSSSICREHSASDSLFRPRRTL
jgi:hypothetical protein